MKIALRRVGLGDDSGRHLERRDVRLRRPRRHNDLSVFHLRWQREARQIADVGPHGHFDTVDATRRHVENEPRTVDSLEPDGSRHPIATGVLRQLRGKDVGVRIPAIRNLGRRP